MKINLHLSKYNIEYQVALSIVIATFFQAGAIVEPMEYDNVIVEVHNVPPINVSPEYIAYNKAHNSLPYAPPKAIFWDKAGINAGATFIAKVIARADYNDLIYLKHLINDAINNSGDEHIKELGQIDENVDKEYATASFKEKLLLFIVCSLGCILLFRYLPEIINLMSYIDFNATLKTQLIVQIYLIEDRQYLLLGQILYNMGQSYLYTKYNFPELQRE